MSKIKYLKLKGNFYLKLIGLIGALGFIAACTCSKKTNTTTTSGKDTVIVPKDTVMMMKYGVPSNYYNENENPPKK
jgi:hypothetical protein